MARKIKYSPAAMKDIVDIWNGVYAVSSERSTADKYIEEMLEKIAGKRGFPESGIPLEYNGMFTGFYSVNFKAYKAFYRISVDNIEVMRILYSGMEYMKVLFGDK